jgi:hypothetical protein
MIILGGPHLVLTHFGGDDGLPPGQFIELFDHVLGFDFRPDRRPVCSFASTIRFDPARGPVGNQIVQILFCQIGVDHFQTAFAVSHHRDAHRHVFADGGGVDVDVNDFGLGGKAIGLAGHPVIESYADADEQIAFGRCSCWPGRCRACRSCPVRGGRSREKPPVP